MKRYVQASTTLAACAASVVLAPVAFGQAGEVGAEGAEGRR